MDLSNIKVIERIVKILHPATKEELGVEVTMMSPRDPRLDKLRNQIAQQQLSAQTKNKVEKVEELKARRLKILFAAITKWEWKGEIDWKGEKPELKPSVFNEICEEATWFLDQIDEAFGDLEAFFPVAESN